MDKKYPTRKKLTISRSIGYLSTTKKKNGKICFHLLL